MGFARRSRKCSNKTRSTDIYSCSTANAPRPQWPGDSVQAIRESKYRWPFRDTLSLEISQQELSLFPMVWTSRDCGDCPCFMRTRRLQRLPTPFPGSPQHNPGTPNLSRSRFRHEANELAFWSTVMCRRPATTALERLRTDGNE